MGRISIDDTASAYSIAKSVYKGSLSEAAGIAELVNARGMNSASATDYIRILKTMLSGGNIRRTVNAQSFAFYLDAILHDFGEKAAGTALGTLREHVIYYATLGRGNLRSVAAVGDKFEQRLTNLSN